MHSWSRATAGVRAILILQRIVPYLGPAPPEAAGSVKGLEQQVASILWSARNLAAIGTPTGGRRRERGRCLEAWLGTFRRADCSEESLLRAPPQGICRLATAAAKPKGTGTAETCPSATTAPIAPQPTARQPRKARIRFQSRRTVTHASNLSRRADRPRGGPAFRRSGNQEICQPRGARSCWLCRGHRNRLPCLQRHFRHGKRHQAASLRPLTLQ